MNKLTKIICNVLFYIFIIVLGLLVLLSKTSYNFPINLWYVYSGSMEPSIRTNDGYFLIQSKEYNINDIITFKPEVLKQEFVTHRIISLTDEGKYITKGDNNTSTDQEGGEPPISIKQVIGKAYMINGKPLIIPYLGILSTKAKNIVEKINIFIIITIGLLLIIFSYLRDLIYKKHKRKRHKRIRLIDIAPYFDPVFGLICLVLFVNTFVCGLTIKNWNYVDVPYVVVSTEGLSSPMPSERFTKTMSIENLTLLPFVTILDSKKESIDIYPKKNVLSSKEAKEYTLSILAPDKIGYYTEKIFRRTYPNVIPSKLFDNLYSKNNVLPLIIILTPGILLNIGLYIWWQKRWRIGRRKVMEWLIPYRAILRNLL